MDKIKVAILKGRRELPGSSGVDYFTLNLYKSLKNYKNVKPTLIYGNYILPGMFKFLHFTNLSSYDVIHNCAPSLGMFIRTNKPIITTFYDDIMFMPKLYTYKLPWHKKILSLVVKTLWGIGLMFDLKRSNIIVAISEEGEKSLQERFAINPKKIIVIPPGIDTDTYKPIQKIKKNRDKRVLRLFYCGRLSYRKGTDQLLDALLILKYQYKFKIKLFLAGTIDSNFSYFEEVQKRKLENDAVFLGLISNKDMQLQYNLADIFVFPSRIEGYGIPPIEALACKTKVVCSSMPSIEPFKEFVTITDLTPKAIAENVLKAYGKQFDFKQARAKIEKDYSVKVVSQKYVELYKELLSEK